MDKKMLVDFTVKNFRSIKDAVTLSVLATNIDEHPNNKFSAGNLELLRTCAIYGANASGKSNVTLALHYAVSFILNSDSLKLDQPLTGYYKPFELDRAWENLPSEFEIEFIAHDSIRYYYKVVYNKKEILEEELYFIPETNRKNILFIRKKGEDIHHPNLKGNFGQIAKQVLPNMLLLSKAANSNYERLAIIYRYFKTWETNSLQFMQSKTEFSRTTQQCLSENCKLSKDFIAQYLKYADVGIEQIEFEKNLTLEELGKSVSKTMKVDYDQMFSYEPLFLHRYYDNGEKISTLKEFNSSYESDGTKVLFNSASTILNAIKLGGVVIIDEVNKHLHPLLTRFIVSLFMNYEINTGNAQLLFTTHDPTLLDPELLRRDQIWFTEKDQFGATNLYSLSEFEYKDVRGNTPFDKWYLSGRFGALPVIGDLANWWANGEKEKNESSKNK